MIERLIEASIRNRFLVLIVTVGLALMSVYAVFDTPIDAIPDLSENQVIVFADWMGRSPREIEDQVTYPLSRKLQGLAGVKAVRSSSEFNFSMITIIFADGIDFYFARQRVTEKLSQSTGFLPSGVMPYLAPDATALGQVFWYTVEVAGEGASEGEKGRRGEGEKAHEATGSVAPSPPHPLTPSFIPPDPGRLWALNKFYIAPQLNSAAGVADVAIVGGMPLEYQIDVHPSALRAYGVTLGELFGAVARSNVPGGGGVIQKNNAEYIVRGIGWLRDKADIENTVVRESSGVPITVRNVATVQIGTQFRRSVYEKNGNEVTGGVVLMRHGQNPLTVTEAVKAKIQELQPGLPDGVHLVPAYDRTRLIHGAIHTLTEVMWHEMLIASVAILLILVHVRSVFVICVTLPLAVLFSFLSMWVLRRLGIIDIQANIMSLAGITISIGILVDQAIVMTENATHALKEKFGNRRVTGDIREFVIPACRMVGRPIFFSVIIMLLSFIPVFLLTGREGKLFHPLAFTKSFALIGVAIISVTVVPALIPTFLKGHLRSEEENAIVRSFIHIYKPLLTWALPRRNLVMWGFAVLLVLAAGMFPLQAIFGLGASETAWRTAFLVTFALVVALTVLFTRGVHWQVLSGATLVWISLWAYHFPKIGVSFMPALDEGTILDMPVTVPRASVTQAADDLKARDALLRGFPEVESVIGKAGRADTPTDPAPLDMVETFVNFRPKELWPKRVLRFDDASRQTAVVQSLLVSRGFVGPALAQVGEKGEGGEGEENSEREALINDATQKALERFDETLREFAQRRYHEFERDLGPQLVEFAIAELVSDWQKTGDVDAVVLSTQYSETGIPHSENSTTNLKVVEPGSATAVATLSHQFAPRFAHWLSTNPALEDTQELVREVAQELQSRGAINDVVRAMRLKEPLATRIWLRTTEAFGAKRRTLAAKLLAAIEMERLRRWRAYVHRVNYELLDLAVRTYNWLTLEELAKAVRNRGLLRDPPHGDQTGSFAEHATAVQLGKLAVIPSPLPEGEGGRRPGEGREALDDRIQAQQAVGDNQEPASDVNRRPHPSPLPVGEGTAAKTFVELREQLDTDFAKKMFLWPRTAGLKGDLVDDEMRTRVMQVPGWSNIFTQPISNRVDMLSTGVRTDIGVKVFGPDLETIDRVCKQIEAALKPIRGARDPLAWPIMGKGYLEIDIRRDEAARYGISVEDIQNEIEMALGGRVVTYTVEKRERFPVRLRYARADREDEESIRQLLVAAGGGGSAMSTSGGMSWGTTTTASKSGTSGSMPRSSESSLTPRATGSSVTEAHKDMSGHAGTRRLIPLAAVADVRITEGPAMIKSENGRLLSYVTLNVRGRGIVGFVDEAQRVVADKVPLPEGVNIAWSGEFEHQVRAAETLRIVFPVVIVLIFVILYLTYHDFWDAALMMLVVPEALAGGVFFLYFFPKVMNGWAAPPLDFSVAVWVGFIACFGMATETGIIMLVYLREAIDKRGGLEKIQSLEELRQAVIEGAVHRLRPKLLTEGVAIIAIFPMVFARGVGGEILAPMALPVLGGLLISDEVVDLFLPVRFYWVRRARWLKLHGHPVAGTSV